MAKSRGGRWLLRIDDLDSPRLVAGMADDILKTLEMFGLVWDGEITWQSRHLDAYAEAFDALMERDVLYPCGCSRKEIAQTSSAPHPGDDMRPYSGNCRMRMDGRKTVRSWRVRVKNEEICFDDLCWGRICQNLEKSGEFVVRRGSGEFAYQLAVVVDDSLTGVTQVVRGADLLQSTPRQIHLQRLLGLPQPDYCHLPLVTGPEGKKLSKRDNLVSYSLLGDLNGKEGILLLGVLRFLGQNPPMSLTGAPCREILEWAKADFEPARMPVNGGELALHN